MSANTRPAPRRPASPHVPRQSWAGPAPWGILFGSRWSGLPVFPSGEKKHGCCAAKKRTVPASPLGGSQFAKIPGPSVAGSRSTSGYCVCRTRKKHVAWLLCHQEESAHPGPSASQLHVCFVCDLAIGFVLCCVVMRPLFIICMFSFASVLGRSQCGHVPEGYAESMCVPWFCAFWVRSTMGFVKSQLYRMVICVSTIATLSHG